MDTKQPENPPAFPQPPGHLTVNGDWITTDEPGMTLRDYFAGQALTGVVIGMNIRSQTLGDHNTEYVTGCCYEIADAMLAARANTNC